MKEKQTNFTTQLAGCCMLAVALLFFSHAAHAQGTVFSDTGAALTNNAGEQTLLQFNNADSIGDEVVLAPGAANVNAVVVPGVSTNVVLNSFTFEYYLGETTYTTKSSTSHGVTTITTNYTYPAWTVDLKFYAMNGSAYSDSYNAPGTLLYDSLPQSLKGSADAGLHTLTYSTANGMFKNGGVLVPLDFAWTVSFGGAALFSTNTVGLPVFSTGAPGAVGDIYPDYWENTGTNYTGVTDNSFVYTGSWLSKADQSGTPMDFGADADSSTTASTPPTVAIVTPKSKTTEINNPVVTVTGTATLKSKIGNNYIAAVEYNLNGAGWQLATVTHGLTAASNWTASITLPVDGLGTGGVYGTTNVFQVQAFDAVNDASTVVSATYNFISEQPPTVVTNGNGSVVYAGGSYIIGKKYTIKVAQDKIPDYYFSNIDYSYTDSTGASQSGNTPTQFGAKTASTNYTFVMESNMDLTVNFVTNRFLAAAGTYNGLYYQSSGADMGSAGYFTLTVNGDTTRSFSGKYYIPLSAAAHSFKGTFALDGTATAASGPNTNFNFVLPLSGDNSTVSGTVVASDASFTSILSGDKQSASSAVTYASNYDLVLPGTGTDTNSSPEGDATMALTVDGVKGLCTLNDIFVGNTAIGASKAKQQIPVIAATGEFPVYVQVNDQSEGSSAFFDGLLIGWLSVESTNSDKLAGSLTWVHDNPSVQGNAVNGLDLLTSDFNYSNSIIASPYTPSASPLITLADQSGNLGTATFAVDGASASVAITNINGAGLLDAVTNYINTAAIGKPVKLKANGTDFSFVIAKHNTDGSVSGSFTNALINATTPGQIYTWGGVLLQAHGQVRGGFAEPGAGSEGDYGSVLIQ